MGKLFEKPNVSFSDIFAYFCFFILVLFLCASSYAKAQDKKDLSDSVVRLHVLANSDKEQDVKIKYLVRDEIIRISKNFTSSCTEKQSAVDNLIKNLPSIENHISQVLLQNDIDYGFDIQIDNELYPTRRYGKLVFPQGNYLSVRVNLGKAQGTNWWCVLFPPICTSTAINDVSYQKQLLLKAGLSDEQIQLLLNNTSESFYPGEAPKEKINIKIGLVEFIKKLTS